MQYLTVIQDAIQRPPIPFDPERQSFKAWATYCLRDRGFKVIYAQNADFAIELRDGSKLYVNTTEDPDSLNPAVLSIVRDRASNQITVIPPAEA